MSDHRQRLSSEEKVAIQKVATLTGLSQGKVREVLHFLLISGVIDMLEGNPYMVVPFVCRIYPDGTVEKTDAVKDLIDPEKRSWAHEYLMKKIMDKANDVMGKD